VIASATKSASTTRTVKTRATSARRRPVSLAPVMARDTEIQVGTASVRDPYDPSTFISTTVNRKVDLLATERSAGRITEAQFLVGRTLQMLWEKQLGVRSGGTWDSTTGPAYSGQLAVSHAFTIEDVRMLGRIETARLVKASNERAARVIGEAGVHFLRAILAEGHSFKSYAEARGRAADWRAISDITRRFRWLLEELTEAQHTARAPGAALIRDGYAAQADDVGERLLRSAALAAERAEAEEQSDLEWYAELEQAEIDAAD
jgi:hypothetical protein